VALLISDTFAADHQGLALSHARVDIDVLDLDVQWSVCRELEPGVDLPADIQEDNEGRGQVSLEESLGIEIGATDWVEGDVEVCDQAQKVHDHTHVRSPDAEGGAEGDLVEAVTIVFPTGLVSTEVGNACVEEVLPCRTEADMGEGNAAEDEEGRDAREREQPVEDVATTAGVQVDERQASEKKLEKGDDHRTALSIDICEKLGAHPCRIVSIKCCSAVVHNLPLEANACIVRVEPNVHEFATLMTEIKMTALKMEGKTLTPAS
jgi:hypothetical protein